MIEWVYWVVSLACVIGGVWFGYASGRRCRVGDVSRISLPSISRCKHCSRWPSIQIAPVGTSEWVAAMMCPKSHMEADRFYSGSPRGALVCAAMKWNAMNDRVRESADRG